MRHIREAEPLYRVFSACPCRGAAAAVAIGLLEEFFCCCHSKMLWWLDREEELERRSVCEPLLPEPREEALAWAEDNIHEVLAIAYPRMRTIVKIETRIGSVGMKIDCRAKIWEVDTLYTDRIRDPDELWSAAEALALAAYKAYAAAAERLGHELPLNREILDGLEAVMTVRASRGIHGRLIDYAVRIRRIRGSRSYDPLVYARL